MRLLAIDPGTTDSAYVVYDTERMTLVDKAKTTNHSLLREILYNNFSCLLMAIEMPACYGMAVGKTTFDTCRWVGIFQQAFGMGDTRLVYRKSQNKEYGIESVTMHLCKSTRAKDSNVRQAIIDRFEPTGGGRTPQIGTKANPGPLYGVSTDVWAALAVAITFAEAGDVE